MYVWLLWVFMNGHPHLISVTTTVYACEDARQHLINSKTVAAKDVLCAEHVVDR